MEWCEHAGERLVGASEAADASVAIRTAISATVRTTVANNLPIDVPLSR